MTATNENDLLAQVKALEESRERLTEGLRHAHAREVALYDALKALVATFIDGSHYETMNPYKRPQVAAALALLETEPKAGPRFMYTTVGDDPASEGQFATLGEMAEANKDDEPFLVWLYRAEVGQSYKNGGGAAPIFVTWRVA